MIIDSWLGRARSLYGDHDRFADSYFKTFKGMYFSGGGSRRGRGRAAGGPHGRSPGPARMPLAFAGARSVGAAFPTPGTRKLRRPP
ncbi:hypothetical protein [Azotobacter beijerinckii]|uniref:hypothetical protein n=1 Tax=Azotobacter beijerinckii TaxID=170623 RepID=UPI0029529832|nr:hypothetical protein [Azotobacter beijerinckii]MDV7211953.1 hypothetical protein [Azotobacter beijerinckii]